jgi:pantoate--beta-alanine ligase
MSSVARKIRREQDRTVGLVPTMGALHEGHLSLVREARRMCDVVVVSVFVNPTQFGPGEDYQKYPRTLEADLRLLSRYPVDLVFTPAVETMYPAGSATLVDVGPVAKPWEGAHRPGHFRGVATVVLKLLNLTAPDVAYFGQKDFQQTLVIRQLVRDLDVPVEIRVCPTVREPDGLAMSSRNAYLSPAQRQQALALSQSLRLAEELVARGERRASVVLQQMRDLLARQPGIDVQYIAIADPRTLASVEELDGEAIALIAAKVGATRLIDNIWLRPK